MNRLLGIHHVSAIAGDPQRCLDFYAGALGMRLVKMTVNFDDPRTYHLYFGDATGTPGSILTFFPWPRSRRGRPGPGMIAGVSLATPLGSLGFWTQRLLERGVPYEGPMSRKEGPEGERVLAFTDPDGLRLEIVGTPEEASAGWEGDVGVPAEHTIRGIHRVTLWEERLESTERTLLDTLGFRNLDEHARTKRYGLGDTVPGASVEVREVGEFIPGVEGPGTAHHVAWRVAGEAGQLELRDRLSRAGLQPTEVIDRQYFRSVYFREPGNVLFELATDGPGFTVDEPVERLGTGLMLPPPYEQQRERIVSRLPTLEIPR